jgi:hypothetical protein
MVKAHNPSKRAERGTCHGLSLTREVISHAYSRYLVILCKLKPVREQMNRSLRRLSTVLLVFGAIAAIGVVTAPWQAPLPPRLLRTAPSVASWLIWGAQLASCACTLVCGYALRRTRPWAPVAYAWFVGSALATVLVYSFVVAVFKPVVSIVIYLVLMGPLFYWGWRIVRSAFGRRSLNAL